MVPLRPGNAGGGKDPDFWRAFDGGEDEVIGGEPANTRTDPDPPEEAVSQGEGGAGLPLLPALRQVSLACFASAAFILAPRRVPWDEARRKAGCGKSARPV